MSEAADRAQEETAEDTDLDLDDPYLQDWLNSQKTVNPVPDARDLGELDLLIELRKLAELYQLDTHDLTAMAWEELTEAFYAVASREITQEDFGVAATGFVDAVESWAKTCEEASTTGEGLTYSRDEVQVVSGLIAEALACESTSRDEWAGDEDVLDDIVRTESDMRLQYNTVVAQLLETLGGQDGHGRRTGQAHVSRERLSLLSADQQATCVNLDKEMSNVTNDRVSFSHAWSLLAVYAYTNVSLTRFLDKCVQKAMHQRQTPRAADFHAAETALDQLTEYYEKTRAFCADMATKLNDVNAVDRNRSQDHAQTWFETAIKTQDDVRIFLAKRLKPKGQAAYRVRMRIKGDASVAAAPPTSAGRSTFSLDNPSLPLPCKKAPPPPARQAPQPRKRDELSDDSSAYSRRSSFDADTDKEEGGTNGRTLADLKAGGAPSSAKGQVPMPDSATDDQLRDSVRNWNLLRLFENGRPKQLPLAVLCNQENGQPCDVVIEPGKFLDQHGDKALGRYVSQKVRTELTFDVVRGSRLGAKLRGRSKPRITRLKVSGPWRGFEDFVQTWCANTFDSAPPRLSWVEEDMHRSG